MVVDHPFSPYPSPNRTGCTRCDYREDVHPKPATEVHPQPEWEAEVIRAAAGGLADPTAIIALARARTLPGPLRDFMARDYDQEALEELADTGNYAPWATRKDSALVAAGLMSEETAIQRRDLRQRALGYVVMAFSLTEQARAL